ncbi:hypothetical protein [Anaplasma phagocytophilum]|uniref:Uncharacterized protein n=3 Tax=Anaplasma phagocytophilum TaxID=948 RepID=Q2GK82_ANAPZ|nr:hypothetical protein [Anaplasma phagocytophilum]KJZ98341.1 hypothetical protein APHCR_0143 [Anaplasma phagocytophilum str. CR1007]ABD43240.1 hypothetical protein APH_0633 [Anaplasma phagocytophilum str. HZ]AGR79405.1 hypothetical protein YYU_03005 [Anaplasma phagocytophilum str. HZ2]AGR80652.1 hypothetical protein WSQ_03005 [Anaplasma phagocytophilum str. JM]AGR81909.1 hypothetical protein YYY_03015 [Anaplasma phagocytophilum str. Dog2]
MERKENLPVTYDYSEKIFETILRRKEEEFQNSVDDILRKFSEQLYRSLERELPELIKKLQADLLSREFSGIISEKHGKNLIGENTSNMFLDDVIVQIVQGALEDLS